MREAMQNLILPEYNDNIDNFDSDSKKNTHDGSEV